jgi:hypothetical protein
LRKTPHGDRCLPCPLAERHDLLQPYVEVEKGKDESRQDNYLGLFSLVNRDESHPSRDTNE